MKYNSSAKNQNKDFTGNLILFATNGVQYNKRYFKRACCSSNMVLWGDSKNNAVLICAKCGFIESDKSKVIPIIEKKQSLWTDSEKELLTGKGKEDINKNDIREIDSLFID